MTDNLLDCFDLKGSIKLVSKDAKTHEVLSVIEKNNMVVQGIRPLIVKLLAQVGYVNATTLPAVDNIRFGDSSSPSTVNDGTLKGNTLLNKPIVTQAALSDSNRKATYSVLLDASGDTVTICEAGLFSGDIMIARTTFGSYTKTPGTYFEFYWTIGYDA